MDKSYYTSNSADTRRGPSPSIWANCPITDLITDPNVGHYFFDDFSHGGVITAPSADAASALVGQNWNAFSTDASNVTQSTTESALIIAETTVDEGTTLYQDPSFWQISAHLGSLWWECRFKVSHTATTEQSFFMGFLERVTPTAILPLTADGALSNNNLVGFHKPEANTTAFDFSYKADGVTAVEVNSDIGTLAAATYIKVGLHFEHRTSVLSCFVNGVKQANTKIIPNNTGTDFPADVPMRLVCSLAVGAAASDNTITIDWVRAAQLAL